MVKAIAVDHFVMRVSGYDASREFYSSLDHFRSGWAAYPISRIGAQSHG
jgi:hypothetical protein